VYRVALYHPSLITHLFSICTPYFAPNSTYTPLRLITRSALPSLTYQHDLTSGAVEESIQSPAEIRSFLNAIYGGRPGPATPPGPAVLDPEVGLRLTGLETFDRTPLLSDAELDYYTAEFSRSGIHGPLNWYRTREANWEDEFEHFFRFGEVDEPPVLRQEVLFILAMRDGALKPALAKGMVERDGGTGQVGRGGLLHLRRREIEANHWVLWERPDEVNTHIREWVDEVVFKGEMVTGRDEAGKESKI
jgi:pimeloyl-ACP methyl ester carboxylesterase